MSRLATVFLYDAVVIWLCWRKPDALAFWQWLALCKLRSNEARCVSPAYIIAVHEWRVRSTMSEWKQRTMRHY